MKKQKPKLTKNFVEKNWHEFKSVSPDVIEAVKKRNERTRIEKLAKDGKINMRIPKPDLDLFIALAEKRGLGYQTFLQSLIRMYVTGQLVEIEEARKILKVS